VVLGRSGPNLEPGTMRVYAFNVPRNGLNIGRKVGPCPESRRRWVLGSVHASSQAVHAANTYRPRFQVRTRPFLVVLVVLILQRILEAGGALAIPHVQVVLVVLVVVILHTAPQAFGTL